MRADMIEEARLWGAADWSAGVREGGCPYDDAGLAVEWRNAWRTRRAAATRIERAAVAILRTITP